MKRVCVVTGGATGIGAAVCSSFAATGAYVVVLDKNLEMAEAFAGTLPDTLAMGCDVCDPDRVNATFAEIESSVGPVDILVNNAGIIGGPEYKIVLERRALNQKRVTEGKPLEPLKATSGMSDSAWRLMLDTHLTGTFSCTRAALVGMQNRRRGSIINMSSIVGLAGGIGIPHYAAAKAGILGFTRAVAQEVAPLGIRVNAVAPGFIDTGMRHNVPADIAEAQIAGIPMGRLGRVDEIAQAVVFLTSDSASYITGQVLSPNGGYISH